MFKVDFVLFYFFLRVEFFSVYRSSLVATAKSGGPMRFQELPSMTSMLIVVINGWLLLIEVPVNTVPFKRI